MNRADRSVAFLIAAIVIAATLLACSESDSRRVVTSSEAAFVPVIESSDLYVSVPRLVLTLLERNTQPSFSDDATFVIRYFEPTEGGIKFHSQAELDGLDVEGLRYLIAEDPPFEAPGQWAIAITVELADGRAESTPRLPFLVRGSARGLSVGDSAPTVPTPTVEDGVLDRMAAVPDESMGMYERSAAELLALDEPFLIVWASAERCAGRRACARALTQATTIHQRGDVAVIHVEPFGRPRSQPLQGIIDAANEAWTIEAEPQFFVVDSDGTIAARFEIVVSTSELDAALDAVSR